MQQRLLPKNCIPTAILPSIAMLLASCGSLTNLVNKEPSRDWENAGHADKAWLIIDAAMRPADLPQPHLIAFSTRNSGVHLEAGEALYWLPPGRYQLNHLHFEEDPGPGVFYKTIMLATARDPGVGLEAGKIYYFGRVDVEMRKNRRWQWTVVDLELLERACSRRPEPLRSFEIVVVGPLAKDDLELPDCNSDRNGAAAGS